MRISSLTIATELGYASTKAQLLTVPPYAAAAILTIFVGWFADRTRQRGICNIACSFLGLIGFSMLIAGKGAGVSYAGTFLGALGIYPCIANTISWTSNNVEGVYKRGITLGFVIGWGNLNGVVSSNIYRAKDRPRYLPGHGTVLGYLGVFLLGGSLLQEFLLRRENKMRLSGKRDHWIEGKNHSEIELLGDKRYVYMSGAETVMLTGIGRTLSTLCEFVSIYGITMFWYKYHPLSIFRYIGTTYTA